MRRSCCAIEGDEIFTQPKEAVDSQSFHAVEDREREGARDDDSRCNGNEYVPQVQWLEPEKASNNGALARLSQRVDFKHQVLGSRGCGIDAAWLQYFVQPGQIGHAIL